MNRVNKYVNILRFVSVLVLFQITLISDEYLAPKTSINSFNENIQKNLRVEGINNLFVNQLTGQIYMPNSLVAPIKLKFTLALLRHSQTFLNVDHGIQGITDSDKAQLNQKGKKDAILSSQKLYDQLLEKFGSKEKLEKFAKSGRLIVKSSPLGRAKDSIEPFIDIFNKNHVGVNLKLTDDSIDPSLREIDFGDMDELTEKDVMSDVHLKKKFDEYIERWRNVQDATFKWPNGDSFIDAVRTNNAMLADWNAKYHGCIVIAMTHGANSGALRVNLKDENLIDPKTRQVVWEKEILKHSEILWQEPFQEFSFVDILDIMKDNKVLEFIKLFFLTRYDGLISESGKYKSTVDYVDKMLASIAIGDQKKSRQKFITDETIAKEHKRLYKRNQSIKYEYDAKAVSEIIKTLPPNSSILDAGAGFNKFLPVVAEITQREDLNYFGTDYYNNEGESNGQSKWLVQPQVFQLPKNPDSNDGLYDVITFRAAMHHVEDFERMVAEIKGKLKPNGRLILIEDSFDDTNDSLWNEINDGFDDTLNKQFGRLSDEQKINFLKFNDWYSNHFYHEWNKMPLPLNHLVLSEWKNNFNSVGMTFERHLNMGFPNNAYAVHQPFTLVMSFLNNQNESIQQVEVAA